MSDKDGVSCPRACGIDGSADFIWMEDLGSGEQFIHPAAQVSTGGDFHLQPYCHRVLTQFTGLKDDDGRWQQLWQRYGDQSRRDLFLDHEALLVESICDPVQRLVEIDHPDRSKRQIDELLEQLDNHYARIDLAGFSPERFLQVAIHLLFPAIELEKSSFVELAAIMEENLSAADELMFKFLDRVFNHRQFRKLLGCNYHQQIDWFGQQQFQQFCQVLLHYRFFTARPVVMDEKTGVRDEVIKLLQRLKKVNKLAEKSGYRGRWFSPVS